MQKHSLRARLSVFVTAALTAMACNAEKKRFEPDSSRGPKVQIIAQAAQDKGISERILLTAAYVQSNFGQAEGLGGASPVSGRTPVFGLERSQLGEGESNDLRANAETLAAKIKRMADSRAPRDTFDWLLLTALAIVGDGSSALEASASDANLRDVSVRIVLLGLINAHNAGFAAILPNNEVFVVAPANDDEKIDLKKLDQGQSRYIGNFRFSKDFASDMFVQGNRRAEIEDKPGGAILGRPSRSNTMPVGTPLIGDNPPASTSAAAPVPGAILPTLPAPVPAPAPEFPRLVIRWCPASTLACFEHLRQTEESPSHFLAYRGRSGQTEIIQFHDIVKDLKWYDSTQRNTISITVVGLAGQNKDTFKPDWIDWEDYVGLRQTLQSIVQQTGRDLLGKDMDAQLKDPEWLSKNIVEQWPGQPGVGGVPAGKPDFLLPAFWDTQVFRELLAMTSTPRDVSQVRIESPTEGQVFPGNDVYFSIYPDPDTTEIQIYQDVANPQPGKAWDLIQKIDSDAGVVKFEDTREFRRVGANGSKARAMRIVCRKADGTLLGTRIVRFVVDGIKDKAK